MISLDAFSELLQVLYAAPLEPEKWESFLTSLCRYTESKNGFLLCTNSHRGTSLYSQGGGMVITPEVMTAYREVYSKQDPFRVPLLRSGRTGVLECEELVPWAKLEQTNMYRDLLAPVGLRHPSLMALTCTIRRFETISFWRTDQEGPMDAACSHLMELLVPHVQSALEIRHVLSVTLDQLATAENMADVSDTATLVLNIKGDLLRCNSSAESLLREGDGLRISKGKLVTASSGDQASLNQLLRNAALTGFVDPTLRPAQALSLSRGFDRSPISLLACPLPRARNGDHDVDVLLLIGDPERPISLPDDTLRSLYRLTPAEVEIANGLLTGYTLEEIAILRKVSKGTVRYQLKRIFEKTSTGSQSELMRLLLNLPRLSG